MKKTVSKILLEKKPMKIKEIIFDFTERNSAVSMTPPVRRMG